MPIKPTSFYKGKKPKIVRDIMEFESTDEMSFKCDWDESLFYRAWGNDNLSEYEEALINLISTNVPIRSRVFGDEYNVSILQSTIYNNYGMRKILKSYYDIFDYWDGTSSDYAILSSEIDSDILNCICSNRYKWGNLMKSCILEFNPLWNVDGEEITTRTLEQDGTITLRKRGTETDSEDIDATISRTGTDTDKKTGTETSAKTGTEANVTDEETVDRKTGTETSAKTGAEQITYDTEEKKDIDGSEATTHKRAITNEESVTTTESTEYYETRKNVETGLDDDNVDTLEYSPDRADTLTKTGTETTNFNNRQDQTTYNTTDTITHDGEETTTYNTQEQTTHNTTDTLTHNTQDTEERTVDRTTTHNTDDTTTRDLLDTERTTFERHGNIGVTTTTALLTEFREYVNFNIIDVIAHDIVNAISESVY